MKGLLTKRAFDIFVVVATIPMWFPVLVVLAIVVRRKLGAPVLFRQARPGFREEVFELKKFRTMLDRRDANGNLLPDSERMTEFGRWLRRSSLDELPELWNVLAGEMSLVGPRPLLVKYLDRYSREQRRRHLVPPGLTGWAQINGRNAIGWEEKFALDVWYVDHRSIWLDAKILFLTIRRVLSRDNISGPGEETMFEFMGDRPL